MGDLNSTSSRAISQDPSTILLPPLQTASTGDRPQTNSRRFLTDLRRAFDEADLDGDGELSFEEWMNSSIRTFILGESMTVEDFKKYFMRIDVNCDEHVNWEELTQFLLKDMSIKELSNKQESILFITESPKPPGSERNYHRESAKGVVLSYQTNEIITLSNDSIRFWNINTLKFMRMITEPGGFASMVVLDHGMLMVATISRTLLLFTLDTLTQVECDLRASPSGKQIKKMTKSEAMNTLKVLNSKRVPLFNVPSAMCEGFALEDALLVEIFIGDDQGYVEAFSLKFPQRRKGTDYLVEKLAGRPLHSNMVSQISQINGFNCYASSSFDNTVKFWRFDSPTFSITRVFRCEGEVSRFVYYEAQKTLITCGYSREATVWSVTHPQKIFMLRGHYNPILTVLPYQTSTGENYIVTLTVKKEFRLWDAVNYRLMREFTDNSFRDPDYTTAVFDFKHHSLITVARGPSIWTEDTSCRDESTRVCTSNQKIIGCHFSSDFGQIILTNEHGEILVYNVSTGTCAGHVKTLWTQESPLTVTSTLDINGRRLMTLDTSSLLSIYNFSNGALVNSTNMETGSISTVLKWVTIGLRSYLVHAGWNKVITLMSEIFPSTFEVARVYRGHKADITCLAASEQGIFSGSVDGTLIFWLLDNASPQIQISVGYSIEGLVCVEPYLFVIGDSGYLKVYLIPRLRLQDAILAHEISIKHSLTAIAYCKEKSTLFTGDSLGYVKIWNLQVEPYSLVCKALIRCSLEEILNIVPINGGQFFVTCSVDRNVRLWDTEDTTLVGVFNEKSSWLIEDKETWSNEMHFETDPSHFNPKTSASTGRSSEQQSVSSLRKFSRETHNKSMTHQEEEDRDEEETEKRIDFDVYRKEMEEMILHQNEVLRPHTEMVNRPRKLLPIPTLQNKIRQQDLVESISGLMSRPTTAADPRKSIIRPFNRQAYCMTPKDRLKQLRRSVR